MLPSAPVTSVVLLAAIVITVVPWGCCAPPWQVVDVVHCGGAADHSWVRTGVGLSVVMHRRAHDTDEKRIHVVRMKVAQVLMQLCYKYVLLVTQY